MKIFDVKNLPTFRHTVTVLNKLDGADSPDHLDRWKKTVLHDCAWTEKRTQSPSARLSEAAEINEGASYLVRVPPSAGYRPYRDWRTDMEGFTFSPGDYIIRGEVSQEVTAETVRAVVEYYRPAAFQVTLFQDNTGTGYLDHYRLEGK